jgi:hypothetical protein
MAAPRQVLFVDTETTTDATQALNFGNWQFCRTDSTGLYVADEGLFYADDLPSSDPTGYGLLREYVRSHVGNHGKAMRLLSRSEFVEKVFYKAAYTLRARVVGFNLPFDLSRIAVGVTEARGRNRGGFSFILSAGAENSGYAERRHRPRVVVRHRDAKGAFISLSKPMSPDSEDLIPEDSTDGLARSSYTWPGRFLDLRTLAFALTGVGHSLQSACDAFGVRGKADSGGHGVITESYVDYCRQDVTATRDLYTALCEDFERHPIVLDPERAVSPASIAKAYLAAMGIDPLLDRLPDFSRQTLGYSMAAFFGGRAECKIRRTPVPVSLVDFTSMYPSVSALMDLHSLQLAESIEVEDATADVRRLLDGVSLEGCLQPTFWTGLVGCALVEPHDDVLPLRAAYDGTTWGIGVNRVTSEEPLWYSIADCVASTLLTGRPPNILDAFRLKPLGRRDDLVRVALGGTLSIDPNVGDPIVAMVEERQRIKVNRDIAATEKRRLDLALKLTANSGSYGIYSEFNARTRLKGQTTPVTVHGRKPEPFSDRVSAPEDPGRYCFPPFATCITGAARLMLAILERCVTDIGGSWAFCDTDSMAIVANEHGGLVPCPGGPEEDSGGLASVRALSFTQVTSIRDRINSLNPYDRKSVPNLLKSEVNSWCYSISAKRYALYDLDEWGHPVLLQGDNGPSEHGLGQLLNPKDPDNEGQGWITEFWQHMLYEIYGVETSEPSWFPRPTMLRTTVTSPVVLRAFRHLNAGIDYQKQIKPFNFLMTAAGAKPPADVQLRQPFRLIAPWEPRSDCWLDLPWVDARNPGVGIRRITVRPDRPDMACIETYGAVAAKYRTHPEAKSEDYEGTPCGRATTGLLARRHVTVGVIRLIGKESNRLEERQSGELTLEDRDQWLTTYDDHDEWYRAVLPRLRRMGIQAVADAVGMSVRRMRDVIAGRSLPHEIHRLALLRLASIAAKDTISGEGSRCGYLSSLDSE